MLSNRLFLLIKSFSLPQLRLLEHPKVIEKKLRMKYGLVMLELIQVYLYTDCIYFLSDLHTNHCILVMAVIAFAVLFCTGWGLKVMAFSPDARLSKKSRSSIFRGELANEEG